MIVSVFRAALFSTAAVAACGIASADILPPADTSPFGLSWGQSRAEIEAAGVTLSECRPVGRAETCIASNLPAPFEDAGEYRLAIDPMDGLNDGRFKSAPITADATGEKGKAIYGRVRAVVQAKHGEGRIRESAHQIAPYEAADQFYECLHRGPSCGHWSTEWRGLGIVVGLYANAPHKGGGGYVEINYFGPVS